jgi:hypothetical protein
MKGPVAVRLRWLLGGAALAALSIWVATALAGSGIGAVFNLGQTNTVNAQSTLTGSTSNPQLKVINQGSSAGVRAEAGGNGVVGIHTGGSGDGSGVFGQTGSSNANSAGVTGKNTAGGAGLSAVVNASVPPLKVNSTARVPFLNADYVDGRHANGLLRVASVEDASELGGSFTPWRSVSINAPTSGFVLLTGSGSAKTDSASCNPCRFYARFRDPSQDLTRSFGQVTSVGHGSSQKQFAALTDIWVVPVSAGAHSFVFEYQMFPTGAPVEPSNVMVSALFVPFDGQGNGP